MKVSSSMIKHVGRDFRRHLPTRGIGELAGLGDIDTEDEGDFFFGKTFQRQQQERLARQRRDVRQPALGGDRQRRDIGVVVDRD